MSFFYHTKPCIYIQLSLKILWVPQNGSKRWLTSIYLWPKKTWLQLGAFHVGNVNMQKYFATPTIKVWNVFLILLDIVIIVVVVVVVIIVVVVVVVVVCGGFKFLPVPELTSYQYFGLALAKTNCFLEVMVKMLTCAFSSIDPPTIFLQFKCDWILKWGCSGEVTRLL